MGREQKNNFNKSNKKFSNEKPVLARQMVVKICNDNYHSLFEQATDAIMVTDFNGNFTNVNSSLCTMFGYTKEELLQLNVRALLDEESLKAHPLRFDLLAAGENIFNERKMVHKNGTIVFVEANAKKFLDDRILVIARDITGRKKVESVLRKSEANLHTIFDTTDTIYVLMDNNLRIISYNPRAYDFAVKELGQSIEISEYFLDYFPKEKRPALLNYMQEVLKGKHISYEVSYPQNEVLSNWYHVKMFPISKDNKNVYGLMMAVSDITEKVILEKKLEEERIKKQEEITDAVLTAEENERHEIGLELHDNVNQILAISRLYLGMAKQSGGKKKNEMIEESNKLINAAIDEIRNISHSLVSPFLSKNGLFKVLDDLIETISKGTVISIHMEVKDVNESFFSDKLKLAIYRIIQEQFNNILKYARAKSICIKFIQINEKLILSIKDDGMGLDTTKKSNGIGLMNIKTRASLFKGSVDIISSSGKGCELIVSFN